MDEEGDCWLQVTRTLPLLPTLCSALEISLRLKQNLHFTEASLHLLLTLAKTQQVRSPGQRGLVDSQAGLDLRPIEIAGLGSLDWLCEPCRGLQPRDGFWAQPELLECVCVVKFAPWGTPAPEFLCFAPALLGSSRGGHSWHPSQHLPASPERLPAEQ